MNIPDPVYLKAFHEATHQGAGTFEIIGDALLVESIPTGDEKTKGGIYLPKTPGKIDGLELNKPTFVRVVAVGNGYYDEENDKLVDLECAPGDVILVGPMAVKWFSTFGPIVSTSEVGVGLTRESEIQVRFKGIDAFNKFCAVVESNLK